MGVGSTDDAGIAPRSGLFSSEAVRDDDLFDGILQSRDLPLDLRGVTLVGDRRPIAEEVLERRSSEQQRVGISESFGVVVVEPWSNGMAMTSWFGPSKYPSRDIMLQTMIIRMTSCYPDSGGDKPPP